MKFFIKDFLKVNVTKSAGLRTLSHLLKKFLMENSFFVQFVSVITDIKIKRQKVGKYPNGSFAGLSSRCRCLQI